MEGAAEGKIWATRGAKEEALWACGGVNRMPSSELWPSIRRMEELVALGTVGPWANVWSMVGPTVVIHHFSDGMKGARDPPKTKVPYGAWAMSLVFTACRVAMEAWRSWDKVVALTRRSTSP